MSSLDGKMAPFTEILIAMELLEKKKKLETQFSPSL